MERLAKHYEKFKVKPDDIFKKFEKKSGQKNVMIDSNQFIIAVKEAYPTDEFYLNRAEEKIIIKKYNRGKWIEYDEFCGDIKQCMSLFKNMKESGEADQFKKPEQVALLRKMKEWI
jgi:hypothetical protein